MAQYPPVTAIDFSLQSSPFYPIAQREVTTPRVDHQFTPNFLRQEFSLKLLHPIIPGAYSDQDFGLHYGFAHGLFTSNVMITWYILSAAHKFDPTLADYDGSQTLPSFVPPEFYECLDMPPPPALPFDPSSVNPLLNHGSYYYMKDIFERQQQIGLQALAWIEKMKQRCKERNDSNWRWPSDPYDALVPTEPVPSPHPSPNPSRVLRRRKLYRQRRRERRANMKKLTEVPPDSNAWGSRYEGVSIYPPRSPPTFDSIGRWANGVVTPWDDYEEDAPAPPSTSSPRAALIIDDSRPFPEVSIVEHPSPPPSPTLSEDYLTALEDSPSDTPADVPAPVVENPSSPPIQIVMDTDAAATGIDLETCRDIVLHPVHSSFAKAMRALTLDNSDAPLTAEEYAFIYEGLYPGEDMNFA